MGCKARVLDFFGAIGRACPNSPTAAAAGGGDLEALEHRDGDDIAEDDEASLGEGDTGAESSGVSASSGSFIAVIGRVWVCINGL